MGLPFLTVFYSKDLGTCCITSIYSIKLIVIKLINKDKGSILNRLLIHENDYSLVIPLIVLVLLSIIIGYKECIRLNNYIYIPISN